MEYKRLTAEHSGLRCEIEEDNPEVGAYLYVWQPDSTSCDYDYLQNTVLDCQEFAQEEFGVPLSAWRPAPSVFS